jgi:metal-dependent amidase/aminoacylase/carboxypeptidase family protein
MSTLVGPELEQQAIAWRRHLHANPELSFEEHQTTRFIEDELAEIGGIEVERPAETGTGRG